MRSFRLLILFLACASVVGAADADVLWGAEQGGIRVGIGIGVSEYKPGADIELRILLENVSASPLLYDYPSSTVTISVLDEDGPMPRQPEEPETGTRIMVGWPTCPNPYPAGKPISLVRSLRAERLLPTSAGEYKIVVRWTALSSKSQLPCDQRGHVMALDPAALPARPLATASASKVVTIGNDGSVISQDLPIVPYTAWRDRFSQVETSFGEMTALHDHATGLEWLHLSYTAQDSCESAALRKRLGGDLEGWRFAQQGELKAFFDGFTGSGDGRSNDLAVERRLQRLLGGPLEQISNPATKWRRRSTSGFVCTTDEAGRGTILVISKSVTSDGQNFSVGVSAGMYEDRTGTAAPGGAVDPRSGFSFSGDPGSVNPFAFGSGGIFLVREK